MNHKTLATLLLAMCCCCPCVWAQKKYTVSGYIKDASSGETLIGATVYIEEIQGGAVSNVYGFYSATLPPGDYSLRYQYVGFDDIEKNISLTENTRLDIEMEPVSQQLEAVIISATAEDANVSEVEMSTAVLDINTIKKMPAFLGEVDIVKSTQMMPGVSTVGEGASGFNVRGGSVGQNLILLDEAPVYNSSHLLGFFSVFNPDAVKDVKLYKGGIPARYGGRIASILDIRMKEGNAKKYEVTGGISSVFSRIAVEGPIRRNKASFIVAGRRSYADIFARPFRSDGAALNFYDLTLKTNYNINDRNRVYLSGYLGRDVFRFDARQGFSWGNKTSTFRWNHLFSDKLFSNLTLFYSDYDYELSFGENDRDKIQWNSRIRTYNLKPEFTYFPNTRNELSFGGEALLYRFTPADVVVVSNGEAVDISVPEKKALEGALYIENEQIISSALTLQYGLRFSFYSFLGGATVYTFNDTIPGLRRSVVSTRRADHLENINSYRNMEPRLSFKYQFSPGTSLKGSYNFTSQYIHLISNTTASNPLDVWTPSTNNIRPQTGHQVALGLFKNLRENQWETSVEVYYRATTNQIDYIDGADILLNEFIEGDVLSGNGRAYGAEFFVKKTTGKLNGWMSYTLARSELQVEGINRGRWYPTRFDQLHNLKITAFYDISSRWSFSGNFTYISGTPTTFPNSRFEVQGYVIPFIEGNERNNQRIPDYHRLDVSFTLQGKKQKKNGQPKKMQQFWVFSAYNLYARRNPFSIYFAQKAERVAEGSLTETQARRVSIIGIIYPSVGYNFKF